MSLTYVLQEYMILAYSNIPTSPPRPRINRHTKEREMEICHRLGSTVDLPKVEHCGKFQYLTRFIDCSALVSTLESCSVLRYICLWMTVEFEVMGHEFLGWFSWTFWRSFCSTNISICPNVQLCSLSCSLVHCVPCEVSLHWQMPRGFAMCVTASANSSALWAGFSDVCVNITPIPASLRLQFIWGQHRTCASQHNNATSYYTMS